MVRCLCLVVAVAWSSTATAGSWGKADTEPVRIDSAWGGTTQDDGTVGDKHLSLGEAVVVGELTLRPVIDRQATPRPDVDLVPLAQALAAGTVGVHEIRSGVVSTLAMVNHSDSPVLAMAGDVLHGGMQDRVLVDDVVLPPSGRPVAVAVHCVERGRWIDRAHAGQFTYGGRVDPGVLAVIESSRDQSATWAAIAARNRQLGVAGDASWVATSHVDPALLSRVDATLRHRFDDKRVVGLVVSRHGVEIDCQIYAHPTVFARDRSSLLRSHLTAVAAVR